jgi:hypothetical protein
MDSIDRVSMHFVFDSYRPSQLPVNDGASCSLHGGRQTTASVAFPLFSQPSHVSASFLSHRASNKRKPEEYNLIPLICVSLLCCCRLLSAPMCLRSVMSPLGCTAITQQRVAAVTAAASFSITWPSQCPAANPATSISSRLASVK